MLNKDFLKSVLVEDKDLFKLSAIKFKHVPLYDELSVVQLWPSLQKDAQFMKYMPDKLPRGRVPDREYFFNVLNTLKEGYLSSLIEHAIAQRNSSESQAVEQQVVEVSEHWLEQLKAVPFISCKCTYLSNPL